MWYRFAEDEFGSVLPELTYHSDFAVRAILAIGSRDCPTANITQSGLIFWAFQLMVN